MKSFELKTPEYIPVNCRGKVSFGGNQCWFPKDHFLNLQYNMNKWGCGTVAIADLFLYLARCKRKWNTPVTALARPMRQIMDVRDYLLYLEFMHNHFAPVFPGGMSGVALAASVKLYVTKYKIPLRVTWKTFLSDDEMYTLIRRMLANDLPVIISIGTNSPMIFGHEGVDFYTKSKTLENTKLEHFTRYYKSIHKHFVTVTGIVALKNKKMMLKISSWGNEYYINYEEYRNYVNMKGDRITSSMLYLEWKE